MPLNLEGFTLTGNRHLMEDESNQDNYLFSASGPFPWAVVSDGCSGAAHPEIGSRDMVALVRDLMAGRQQPVTDVNMFEQLIIAKLSALKYSDPVRYCATAVVLQVFENKAHVFFFGDGSLLIQNRDGHYRHYDVSYTRSAPRFLHYFSKGVHNLAHSDDRFSREWNSWQYPPQDAIVMETIHGPWVDKATAHPLGLCRPFELVVDLEAEDVWNLAICSDGVMSLGGSPRKLILGANTNQGLPELILAASKNSGFVRPDDDATLVNLFTS